jgi:hypothetical protein
LIETLEFSLVVPNFFAMRLDKALGVFIDNVASLLVLNEAMELSNPRLKHALWIFTHANADAQSNNMIVSAP